MPAARLGPAVVAKDMAAWPFAREDRPSKIVCIGRNYAEHAHELGNPVPEEPILFLKPPSSIIGSGADIVIPRGIGAVHHEVELGVVVGRTLRRVEPEEASEGVGGWCLAIDLTARELQNVAKASGRPWTVAKGYDTFCPVSGRLDPGAVDPRAARLELLVDGDLRQDGNTADMLWKVPDLLAYVSNIMTLEPGDLVLTGTPKGVGPIEPGQQVEARLDGRTLLRNRVIAG